MTKAQTYELVCQEWDESEAGWGQRPDGYTLYLNAKDHAKHIAKWTEDRRKEAEALKGVTPSCYDRMSGKPFRVKVPKKVFDEVKKTKGGYIWGEGNICRYERAI